MPPRREIWLVLSTIVVSQTVPQRFGKQLFVYSYTSIGLLTVINAWAFLQHKIYQQEQSSRMTTSLKCTANQKDKDVSVGQIVVQGTLERKSKRYDTCNDVYTTL
jgi:hypothetical protein